MPNDNKQSAPSDTNSTNNSSLPPIFVEPDALPPMPNLDAKTQDIETPTVVSNDSGSAAPENDIKIDTVMPAVVTNSPKKKFAGGKVIATILGLFILVGGVGAGVYLTGQDQNIQEKAGVTDPRCAGIGNPAARQACNAGSFTTITDTYGDNVEVFEGNDNFDLGNGVTRCQTLALCKNTSCSREWDSDCGGQESIPTPDTASATCQSVSAYDDTWTELTTIQLSSLKAGDKINYCVKGFASEGVFNKARFTINGVMQSETTTIRPSSTDFCQEYTIPAGVTTFNVVGDIFHEVLGWK